jgi:hypothetical protein
MLIDLEKLPNPYETMAMFRQFTERYFEIRNEDKFEWFQKMFVVVAMFY